MAKSKLYRITIDLNELEKKALEKISNISGNSNRTIMRNALVLLHEYINRTNEGFELVYQKPGSNKKVILKILAYEGLDIK